MTYLLDSEHEKHCSLCGAKLVAYRHRFNKTLAAGLYKLAAAGGKGNISEIGLTTSQHANFQKLRYWGLIDSIQFLGSGYWYLTPHGELFVMGLDTIKRVVVTFRTETLSFEGDTVFFKDEHPTLSSNADEFWDAAIGMSR